MTRSSPVSRGSAGRGAATLAFVCTLFASVASAQTSGAAPDREAEARAHFRLSQSHYELGHFAEAAAELEQAYALSPRADLLYNLYVARRDAGQLAAAASALRQYLDEGEDIENAALLRHRLAALEAQLATESSAGGEASAAADASAGSEATGDDAAASESEPLGGASASASDAQDTRSATSERATEASSLAPGPSRSPSPVGYAVIGVGAAALVAGLVTAGLALDRYGALEATCGADHSCPAGTEAQRDEGVALATSTDVLLVSGGVIAAVGVVLLFTVLDEAPAAPPVSASCDGSGCGATASFTF